MRIEEDLKLDYSDVLFRPKRSTLSSRKDVNLMRTYKFKYSNNEWSGIPIMAANMDGVGELGVAEKLSEFGMITCLTKQHDVKKLKQYKKIKKIYQNIALSIGIKKEDFDRLDKVLKEFSFIKFICIDVANGYMNKLCDFCLKVRNAFPDKIIVAGNVVSREISEDLILRGKADIVKVGIGPGSACLTRTKTGIGMPQLSAIMECSDAAHGVNGYIIGDGGITCPGDVSKGFGGGADFIMIGGQFAGHDENPGEIIEENGQKFKLFYGMSSDTAMKTHYGKVANYRSSEGRTIKIKYKGALENTILDYLGGIRSTCTYINSKQIKDLPKCCTFVRVNRQLNTIYA